MIFDWIGRSIVIASAITLGAAPARADKGQDATEALVTVHRFLRDEPSSDPDRATLRYGILGGRWQAMAGQRVVLVGGSLATCTTTSRASPPSRAYGPELGFRLGFLL